MPSKDSNDIDRYYFIWCSLDGTNDASVSDTGDLHGDTISTSSVSVVSGDATVDSSNNLSVTIKGVVYAVNTVTTVVLSGGTNNTLVTIRDRITTSSGRQLDKTMTIPIKEH